MRLGADILVLAIFLYLGQEWLRRQGRRVAWGVFFALPLLLTPLWLQGNCSALARQFDNPVVFCWLKLYSISLSSCWFTWLRFTSVQHRRWAQYICLLGLPLNIVEAIVQDIVSGQLHNFLNAAAGMLLVVTLPFSLESFQTRARGECHDLHYDGQTRVWVIGYTIWNWVFIYHTFPVIAGQHLAVLGAALAVGMYEPRRWLQTRSYTLAIALYLLFTFPDFLVSRMGTVEWSSARGDLWGASISLGFMIALAFTLVVSRVCEIVREPSGWDLSCRRIVSEE